MYRYQPLVLRPMALALVVMLLASACAGSPMESASDSIPGAEPAPSTLPPNAEALPGSTSTVVNEKLPDWATSTVVEMDPLSLAPLGPAIPAGLWTEGAVVTDDLIALATWPLEETERADARWRLVVASRETGEVFFDERIGGMNVIEMFAPPSGEVTVVQPIRSADLNFADGFVVRRYDPGAGQLRQVAHFAEGGFQPNSLTLLSDGRLGLVGAERNGDVFDRIRIVIFDWQTHETVTDVVLEDLPLKADAPDGVFVEDMHHPVVWDEARDRALVVHAHEEVITTVSIPDGKIEKVPLARDQSLLGALLTWVMPPVGAKGLPSVQRHAVISGDHLYVAGEAVTFESKTNGSHSYRIAATDLLKIDLETLRIEKSSQSGAAFIEASASGGYLIGGGHTATGHINLESTTIEEEYTGLLVIDPDTLGVIERHAEANITSRFEVQASLAEDVLYTQGPGGSILTFDPKSGSVNTSLQTGPFEPELLKNSLRYASHSN